MGRGLSLRAGRRPTRRRAIPRHREFSNRRNTGDVQRSASSDRGRPVAFQVVKAVDDCAPTATVGLLSWQHTGPASWRPGMKFRRYPVLIALLAVGIISTPLA